MKTFVTKEQMEAYNAVRGPKFSTPASTKEEAEEALAQWVETHNKENHRGIDMSEILPGDITAIEALRFVDRKTVNGRAYKQVVAHWTVARKNGGTFQRAGLFYASKGKPAKWATYCGLDY